MANSDLPIEVSTATDWDGIHLLLQGVFHDEPDEAMAEADRDIFEPERSLLVRDGGAVVAHAAAFTREMTVPGAVVPAAHVTMVGVAPTHRRRRLLTRLMRRQLREIHAAGREPIAALWASESRIYPRFGYGSAAQRLVMEIEKTGLRLAEGTPGPDDGDGRGPDRAAHRLRVGDPLALQPDLAEVYERLRADRPGWSSRNKPWWGYVLGDFPSRRHGSTHRRVVVADGPDGPAGYAVWRTRSGWNARGPQGAVVVDELAAADPGTYRALWRFLLGIDLTRSVQYHHATVDEPLQHLVDEPRELGSHLADGLWIRLVDVPAALAARHYATGIDVVFEVTDPLLPENAGRWRLTAAAGTARCTRTDAPAELACDVRDLGAVYLGGPSLGGLAAAGRVREVRPGSLARASAAFGWHRAPAATDIF